MDNAHFLSEVAFSTQFYDFLENHMQDDCEKSNRSREGSVRHGQLGICYQFMRVHDMIHGVSTLLYAASH